jgi:hypothetical protein
MAILGTRIFVLTGQLPVMLTFLHAQCEWSSSDNQTLIRRKIIQTGRQEAFQNITSS